MNKGVVLYAISIILILLSIILLIPLGMAFYYRYTDNPYGNREITAFLITILSSLLIGIPLRIFFPSPLESAGENEGFAIVTFTWITLTLLGSLPFYISGTCDSFVDAYFETMSGFSTTGATIFKDIEGIPRSILLWRSLTNWLGGMGIIMLSIAILPALGIGGYHLFRAEVSGGSAFFERLKPRIVETARAVLVIYISLSVLEIFLLFLGGMSLFDSICHTFANIATGGFSTRNESIAYFHSGYIEFVIIIFMFIAACNFTLHYQILHGQFRDVFKNPELRFFASLLLICIVVATLFIRYSHGSAYLTIIEAFRVASFQVVSIATTTGFTTTDFDKWPDILRLMLVVLMITGGCVGSTAGAIKIIRIIVILKLIIREFHKLIQPRAIIHIKLGEKSLDRDIISNILGFCMMYIGIFILCSLIMAGLGLDLATAISSVATTMGGVGPGLGRVTSNFSDIPVAGKWVSIICMFLGRLEIYSVMILFLPLTWRR
ncbi:MAG: TrkH family potassium uptake protein [Nitrospinae bacterium]|nr:TrkH family potassium uptake protein [Nitrospinota bacterium]